MRYKVSAYIIGVVVFSCMFSYLFFDNNNGENLENRQMAEFSDVFYPSEKESIVYRETFVERLEEALKDQFAFRKIALILYMGAEQQFARLSSQMMINNPSSHWYEPIGNYVKIDGTDWLSIAPSFDPVTDKQLSIHVQQIEKIHKRNPEIHIYNYFVNQAFDTDWYDEFLGKENIDSAKEIEKRIPDYIISGQYILRSFEQYKNEHYKTDHHWNHKGSNHGYQDIYRMMSSNLDGLGDLAFPRKEINFSEMHGISFKGSYANGVQGLYDGVDEFSVYKYDLPEQNYYVIDSETGKDIEVYEQYQWVEYDNNLLTPGEYESHYASFYGFARDMKGTLYNDSSWIFKTVTRDDRLKHNLLIIGDSYNRAFREPLSTNFAKTLYLDHRAMGKYDINTILDENQIDVILLSGHGSTWLYDYSLFSFGE